MPRYRAQTEGLGRLGTRTESSQLFVMLLLYLPISSDSDLSTPSFLPGQVDHVGL